VFAAKKQRCYVRFAAVAGAKLAQEISKTFFRACMKNSNSEFEGKKTQKLNTTRNYGF